MSVSETLVKLFLNWLFFCTSNTRDTFFIGISLIFLSGTFEVSVGFADSTAPVLFIVSMESSTLPVSLIVPWGAVTPEPGTLLLATSRPAVSISFCRVCSMTGSPRVSLGLGIVTLPAAVGICTSVVRLSLRGVRSSFGDCPRRTSLAGIVLSTAVVNASR